MEFDKSPNLKYQAVPLILRKKIAEIRKNST